MISLRTAHGFLVNLQRWIVLAYAIAIFFPITVPSIVHVGIIVVWALLTLAEYLLYRNLPADEEKPEHGLAPREQMLIVWNAPFTKAMLCFSVCVSISGFMGGGFSDGIKSFFTLKSLNIYFLATQAFFRYPGLRDKCLEIVLAFGAVAGVWGAIQQLFDYNPFLTFDYLQATGFLLHPMPYAGQMQILSMMALCFLFVGGYRDLAAPLSNKVVFMLVTAANCLGVFFASERSAWLGIVVAILALTLLVSRKLFFKALVVLMVVIVLAWNFVPVVKMRVGPLLTNYKSDVSTKVRFLVWQSSYRIWTFRPLFGVGIRNFPELPFPEANQTSRHTHLVHAHSNYLHVLATLGIVGFTSYMYLLFRLLWHPFTLWKRFKESDSPGSLLEVSLALGILGAVISLSVAGIFEFNFGTDAVRLFYWFVLAFLTASSQPAARSN